MINYLNTFNDSSVNNGAVNYNNFHCTFKPIGKVVELIEENKKLYERLLQAEKEISELIKDKK